MVLHSFVRIWSPLLFLWLLTFLQVLFKLICSYRKLLIKSQYRISASLSLTFDETWACIILHYLLAHLFHQVDCKQVIWAQWPTHSKHSINSSSDCGNSMIPLCSITVLEGFFFFFSLQQPGALEHFLPIRCPFSAAAVVTLACSIHCRSPPLLLQQRSP